MRAFGEGFVCYRPPVNMRTTQTVQGVRGNGNEEIALNWITPHQKWGIHSTYTDNLIMLTLSRGGPCVWISEIDAKRSASSTTTGSSASTATAPWWPAPWSASGSVRAW